MSLEKEFISNIKNVTGNRKHKINNSYGVYDAYKYYRKNKPKDSKYILSESEYFNIIRSVNKQLVCNILNGENIKFPYRMGYLELRKTPSKISFENGKLVTNLPIDWDRTLKLWFEDKEAFDNKTLIRVENKEIYKIHYNKSVAIYNNKSYYSFNVNRSIKNELKNKIKEGTIDTPYTSYGRKLY